MIFDTDDLYQGHDRMDLLVRLKEANPAFRMTAFAIPSKCSDDYLDSLPEWIQVVPHGWYHGDPPSDGGECKHWSYNRMMDLIEEIEDNGHPRWAKGFKAPGWQISDECYRALWHMDWWVADQTYNNQRRPPELRVHLEGDGDPHVHTHVQNVCGNGLEETFPSLLAAVTAADSFRLISETVARVPV